MKGAPYPQGHAAPPQLPHRSGEIPQGFFGARHRHLSRTVEVHGVHPRVLRRQFHDLFPGQAQHRVHGIISLVCLPLHQLPPADYQPEPLFRVHKSRKGRRRHLPQGEARRRRNPLVPQMSRHGQLQGVQAWLGVFRAHQGLFISFEALSQGTGPDGFKTVKHPGGCRTLGVQFPPHARMLVPLSCKDKGYTTH